MITWKYLISFIKASNWTVDLFMLKIMQKVFFSLWKCLFVCMFILHWEMLQKKSTDQTPGLIFLLLVFLLQPCRFLTSQVTMIYLPLSSQNTSQLHSLTHLQESTATDEWISLLPKGLHTANPSNRYSFS